MSDYLTPKRLASIRRRVRDIPVIMPEQDAAELLAEVDRLREGIEELRRDAMTANAVEPSRALHETASRCAALLNPEDPS